MDEYSFTGHKLNLLINTRINLEMEELNMPDVSESESLTETA